MAASFLVSTAVVALAEIGDKTQLLALLLTTRFRRPLPIIAGILFATLANHAAAGLAGEWLAGRMEAQTLRWLIGGSLLAIAAWTLRPDTLNETRARAGRYGVFIVTLVAFFLVEMGDKTQIATVVLAAQYQALVAVVLGTTLGMMIANVPVVLVGNALAEHIPLRAVRIIAALLFTVLGVLALSGVGTI
ncbi:MAG: TMEM165/GDT1 family protein [Betaproteobacteria bacterium]|nr:TMEM165/GDT1 family protein [Betaproteobacteria bacterium]MDH3436202.1 TMEM165/GDT1 family protein [Betaproteobacteria bacterium]